MSKKIRAILFIAALLLLFFIGNRIGVLYNYKSGNLLERFSYAISGEFFKLSLREMFRRTDGESILFGIVVVVIAIAFYIYNFVYRKNTRQGEEQGSARWGHVDETLPFADKDDSKNILLSERVRLALSNKGKDYKYHTNKNILVVGGSGSGKTRFYVKPNLLQAHSCYIVTDPKGSCMPETANALQKDGYKIYSFNTIDFSQSMGFDPFKYISSEQDILKTVDNIILNTKRAGSHSSEQFWEDGERMIYVAIIAYIIFYAEYESEKSLNTFLDLFGMIEIPEERDEKTALDFLFEDLETEHPGNFASRTYFNFKKAYPETASGIIITACARLMPFYISDLRKAFEKDEMELDKIGFEKTAHFLIVDDTDSVFDFAIGLLYSTMLTRLIRNADKCDNRALPIHTRLIMDEAANIAQVRNIEKVTAQVRSRGISIDMIYQNSQQLKALYKDKASVIEGNFDTMLFLGSEEKDLGKLISEKIGDQTVAYQTSSQNRGRDTSYSASEHITKRRLLAPEEVRSLPADECIVFIKGLPPIKDKKFIFEKHSKYKDTGDYDESKIFRLQSREQENKPFAPKLEANYIEGNTHYMEISV